MIILPVTISGILMVIAIMIAIIPIVTVVFVPIVLHHWVGQHWHGKCPSRDNKQVNNAAFIM